MKRHLQIHIESDLEEKMVFLGGPRQVGKTTLAFHLLRTEDPRHPAYLNWDAPQIQRALLQGEIPSQQPLLIFDEIHKYKKWRNLMKGLYDTNKSKIKFLITGSARLDYFRKGGDSLQGRYHFYRLHPFSPFELSSKPNKNDVDLLLKFGGFPEPLIKANERHWRRWQLERQERVVQEDLVSMESVKDITQLKLLSSLLPAKVGSLLSISNLKQDLNVAFETVDKWISTFENLYYCFRLQAYGFSLARAANKEKKLFMWDWSLVEDPASRFENMVASLLLKFCHFQTDYEGHKMELNFFRDSKKREVDFVVMKNKKPLFGVECKTGEKQIASNLKYFSKVLPIPKYYQVHLGTKHSELSDYKTEIIPFAQFARMLEV